MPDSSEVHDVELSDTNDEEVLSNKSIPLEKLGEVVEKIEQAKQITAIKQIEATDKDNERQFQYAQKKDIIEQSKWNKSFNVGAGVSIVIGIVAIVLIFTEEKDLGIGLLATVISGVFGFIAGAGSCKK